MECKEIVAETLRELTVSEVVNYAGIPLSSPFLACFNYLDTGKKVLCGANSQELASASADCQSKSGSRIVAQNYKYAQKWKMTPKFNGKLS